MCTLVHLSAPVVAWVFTFDILQQEIDAIDEQEKVGCQERGDVAAAVSSLAC